MEYCIDKNRKNNNNKDEFVSLSNLTCLIQMKTFSFWTYQIDENLPSD